jgi:predicted amidophosphoribosyltransferase
VLGGTARRTVPVLILLGSFKRSRPNVLHDLIQSARAGEARALTNVLQLVRERASLLPVELGDGAIVTVPGHQPRGSHPLLATVASDMAERMGWTHAERALLRRQAAPEAKFAAVREERAEVATLAWYPPPGQTIVLLDDVLRTGTTLRVCVNAIRRADPRPITAVVLAESLA